MNPSILVVGGENHDLRIPFLLELRKKGFQVSALGTGDPGPFAQAGLDYYQYGFDRFVNPLADWHTIKALSKLIADLRPDIVQSFDTKPNLYAPIATRRIDGTAVVRTINGLGWIYSSRSITALALRPVFDLLHKLTASSTALNVFQNRDDQLFFERRRLIGQGGNQLIPGSGVDVEGFERAAATGPAEAELRDELSLGGCEVVITVTRLSRIKGIATLLEAAALVHESRPNVRFLLVGSRESEGKLAISQSEIDRHAPYVKAIGSRPDVPALLRLADVFAFPTELREGVPRVLLEAALSDLPVVTTDMPGCVDVVQDGATGCVVPPGSPRLLADRIVELLRDRPKAHALAANARELVRREFNLEITTARYAAAYLKLTDGSGLAKLKTGDKSRAGSAEGNVLARRRRVT